MNSILNKEILGKRLQSLRVVSGKKLAEVENQTGIKKGRLSEIENNKGDRALSLEAFTRLVMNYGGSSDYCLGLTNNPDEVRQSTVLMQSFHELGQSLLSQLALHLGASFQSSLIAERKVVPLLEAAQRMIEKAKRVREINEGFDEDIKGGGQFISAINELEEAIEDCKPQPFNAPDPELLEELLQAAREESERTVFTARTPDSLNRINKLYESLGESMDAQQLRLEFIKKRLA